MKVFIRSFLTANLLALCTLLAPISAMAQGYPSRAVTLINPYPPAAEQMCWPVHWRANSLRYGANP